MFLHCSNLHAISFQSGETFIRKISFAEGLNTKVVYDLYVDSNGLLYLGTNKGLLSYNGVFFKHYPFKDNLGISIDAIQQDQDARLWCKNFSNQLFYFENETLVAYEKANYFLSEQNENLVDFTFYNNKLFILTEKSLFFENDVGFFIEVYSFKKNNEEFFFSLFNDVEKNKLLLSTNTNVLVFKDDEVIGKFAAEKGQKEVVFFEDELLYILKGRKNGLFSLQKEIKNEKVIPNNIYFYNLTQTNQEFWLCTSNGVFEINLKSKGFGEHLLANNRITDVVVDNEGNHWISSLDEGLFFMPNRDMKRLSLQQDNAIVLNTTSIKANEQGNIFVGTSNGKIIQYDTNQQPIFTYQANTNTEVEYIYPYKNELITSVGLFELGKVSPKIDAYFGKGIAEDAFGNFAIANYNLAGLIPTSFKGQPTVSHQLEKKQTVDYTSSSLQLYIFRNKRARAVHYSQKGGYYFVGYSDGLYRFGIDGSTFQIKTPNNQPIIATDFHEMENGDLWVSSTQQGLLSIKDTEVVKHFHYKNGLSDNKCKKIQADDNGIWVITEESLDYYDIKNEKIKNYGNNLGLNGVNINDFYVNKDFIWFATNEGVIYFPKSILEIELNPYLEINALQNDGMQLPENASIPFSKNNVVVEFNSVLYKSLGNYQFEYKLEPFHQDWQSQNAKQNKLNFVALQPNTYNLKARIKTGSIVSSEISFSFEVNQPFWAKFWFIGLAILFITLLLIMVYNWAVLKTKRQQNIKEMLAISQLTALRS